MAGIDLHDLRMQEFPHNVRLALNKLEACLESAQTPQLAVLQQRIIDDFIFFPHETNTYKSNPSKVLSFSIKELVIVRVLTQHLSGISRATTRNNLMLLLFHPASIDPSQQASSANPYAAANNPYATGNPYLSGSIPYSRNNPYTSLSAGNTTGYGAAMGGAGIYGVTGHHYKNSSNVAESKLTHRLNVLSALISLNVATRNISVLEAVASWMQSVCCLSGWCGQVCKRIIAEYCLDLRQNNNVGSSSSINLPPTTIIAPDNNLQRSLQLLPSVSALFTASLVTCWAQLYARLGSGNDGHNSSGGSSTGPGGLLCRRPPLPLLRIIVHWLQHSRPSLLLTTLTSQAPATFITTVPTQPPPAAVTAVAPLLRWCVEAPFFLHYAATDDTQPSKQPSPPPQPASPAAKNLAISQAKTNVRQSNETSSAKLQQESIDPFSSDISDNDDVFGKTSSSSSNVNDKLDEEKSLYSDLHLCLLQTLHATPSYLQGAVKTQVLSCRQVLTVVEALTKLLEPGTAAAAAAQWGRGSSVSGDVTMATELSLEGKMLAVNRLAQVILVASTTGCLSAQHGELWTALRRLPIYNRLVKMLLTSHQGA